MNYTLKDADKICVGDTLTLEDGSMHETVKDERTGADWMESCKDCSMLIIYSDSVGCRAETNNNHVKCNGKFHFKQIKL